MSNLEIKISDNLNFKKIESKVQPKISKKEIKKEENKEQNIEFRSMIVPEKKL